MIYNNRSVLDWPTGTTVYKPDKCYNGYTIVNPYRSELIFLIDMAGRVVNVWQAHPKKIAESWFMKRLSNGNWMNLIFQTPYFYDASSPDRAPDSFSTIDFEKAVVELDWEGNLIWEYIAPKDWVIHHDMARLQNGNTLILMEKIVEVPSISDKPIAENFFIEVTPRFTIQSCTITKCLRRCRRCLTLVSVKPANSVLRVASNLQFFTKHATRIIGDIPPLFSKHCVGFSYI